MPLLHKLLTIYRPPHLILHIINTRRLHIADVFLFLPKGADVMLDQVIYSETEIIERLAYWQEKLRLRDWLVQVHIKREKDFTQENCNAYVHYNISNKSAFITIMDPKDFDDWLPQDMEWLLVHELLHLHFGPFDTRKNITAIEQSIESITYGLIQLERK